MKVLRKAIFVAGSLLFFVGIMSAFVGPSGAIVMLPIGVMSVMIAAMM